MQDIYFAKFVFEKNKKIIIYVISDYSDTNGYASYNKGDKKDKDKNKKKSKDVPKIGVYKPAPKVKNTNSNENLSEFDMNAPLTQALLSMHRTQSDEMLEKTGLSPPKK